MGQIKMAKGWRRWVMIIFILVMLALAVIAFSTGCSSKSNSGTTSPILQLQTNMSSLSARVDTLETSSGSKATDIAEIRTDIVNLQTNERGYGERIANLEAKNCSCNSTSTTCDLSIVNASMTMLGLRLQSLEGMNISARLAALETRPYGTPTPTPSGSATPTPTPSGNHPPVILTLNASSMSSTNQSWMIGCLADDADGDILSYDWAATNGNIYLLYSTDTVFWVLTANGSQSIACQVSDGKGGYDLEIISVYYP